MMLMRFMRCKEQITVGTEYNEENEVTYLVTLDMLRRVYKSGEVKKEVLDRLNKKNAEALNCKVIPLI